MDGLDIFNVYIMGSIEMLTVFISLPDFLRKGKVYLLYIVCLSWNDDYDVFPTGSIMELLVYVLLLMAGGFLYVEHTIYLSGYMQL